MDQNGLLNLFWAGSDGVWNGPEPIGPHNLAHFGACMAVTQHAGIDNRTDLFLIDKDGQLNSFWVLGPGKWNGPEAIGPSELAHKNGSVPVAASQRFGVNNQTDVFVVDTTGQLNVFSAVGSGKWSGPQKIGPTNLTHAVASVTVSPRFGTKNQTDVYVVDTNGQLNVFSAVGSGDWSGPHKIGPAGLSVSGAAVAVGQKPGTTDQTQVFLFDNHGQLNIFSADAGGKWSGPITVGPQNVAPAGSPLILSPQFGVPNQTDLFVINQAGSQTGTDAQGWPTVFISTDGNQWNGPKELVHDL